MGAKSKPRAGSKAHYPRKRARYIKTHFKTVKPSSNDSVKPMNFLGYKVGMTQVSGTNTRKNAVSYGQVVVMSATVVEVPALKVFGFRGHGKNDIRYGEHTLYEEWNLNTADKNLDKKINSWNNAIENHKDGKVNGGKKLDNIVSELTEIRLLAHTQPYLTTVGKKKPEIVEVILSGNVQDQIKYAQEKIGKEIKASEVFSIKDFLDIKAVTKGKGIQGPVRRFGVKKHRPKMKKSRYVGSIGPWNPSTVMWTVARAGQTGYHTRTELNKQLLLIDNNQERVNKSGGFPHYGEVRNDYLVIAGSLPGPNRRAMSLRQAVRPLREQKTILEGVDWIAK